MGEKICKALENNCWRQGVCLYLTKNDDLIKNKILSKTGLYIVITQSCDLLHKKLANDPHVELIYAKKIEKENGRYIAGQHPREIHIPIKTSDNKNKYYKCHIKNKLTIDKKHLAKLLPSNKYTLEENTKQYLIKWIIKRYNRTAFPYAFNERINKKTHEKIKRIVENHTLEIHHGIFVKLSSYKELNDAEPYVIEIYILAEPSITEKQLDILKADAKTIETLINKSCNNIMVDACTAKTLDDISVFEYLGLDSWDFEYLSSQKDK